MFEIVLGEQTPACPQIRDPRTWISENQSFLSSFLEFAKGLSNALGIAASQLAENGEHLTQRAFAIFDVTREKWSVVVNPIISGHSGPAETKEEGCLTWPGKKILADRYPCVVASYWTTEGRYVDCEKKTGLEAQIWQHEVNHLNGVEEKVVAPGYWTTYRRKESKVGRNDPCPCGSEKKYKKCCGK